METTGNILYILPIIFVITIAKWVGDIFNIGIYDMHIVKFFFYYCNNYLKELKAIPFVEPMPNIGYE